MSDLSVLPNTNSIDSTSDTANAQLVAQLIIFYLGVGLFLIVCCIPPFTVCLPFLVPIIIVLTLGINLACFIQFIQNSSGSGSGTT
tara:strand:- start:124 stop:381 length:258 start_codon:yes stop_codon:yes gene_type:complete